MSILRKAYVYVSGRVVCVEDVITKNRQRTKQFYLL